MEVLVAGATGAQGGAVARALLAKGHGVRALTRNTDSAPSQTLARAGATLVRGDLDDEASLASAVAGAGGVFSVQWPDQRGADTERLQAGRLISAALKAGMSHFVQSSVSGAGTHADFPGWDQDAWDRRYWTDKWDIEQAVRAAGFAAWSVLKPAFLMDNFAEPKASRMFPRLRAGEIATVLSPGTRMPVISADDVGAFAAAAFERPEVFHAQEIELASEGLTTAEMAATLSQVVGRPVSAVTLTPEQALAAGQSPGWVRSQQWSNVAGYPARAEHVAPYGVPLTRFADWAVAHREQIHVD
jgi:uncharacterized protein YbjT (DUF2867 family)